MKVFPEDLLYSHEHIWVRVDGDMATLGITDYAQEESGRSPVQSNSLKLMCTWNVTKLSARLSPDQGGCGSDCFGQRDDHQRQRRH